MNDHPVRLTSKAQLRAALVAMAPGLAKVLPPLPQPRGKDGFHTVPDPAPAPDSQPPVLRSAPDEGGSTPAAALDPRPPTLDILNTPSDWLPNLEQTRRQEWEMSQQLFAAARMRLLSVLVGTAPKSAFGEIARFADLASRLARRAAGTADPGEAESSASSNLLAQFEEAIKQVCSESTATVHGSGPQPLVAPKSDEGGSTPAPGKSAKSTNTPKT